MESHKYIINVHICVVFINLSPSMSQMALLLCRQLRTIHPRMLEGGCETAWDAFLRSAFPFPSGFIVFPARWASRGQQCFRFEVVYDWKHTVFVVHQKSVAEMDYTKECQIADRLMRKRLSRPDCPLPTFRGVSTLGSTFALYAKQHTTGITPPSIPNWSHSLLDLGGVGRILEIVKAVKKDCREFKRPRKLTAKVTSNF
ncbi:uncharacterized protein BXZ73DRAFT_102598 [Epithele typhae]|uniref:uncharacterized protein n=1 Tax=Epithele typhae TaxID=378194 RepID=UPI002007B87D|nr:uncharacterized protein BXZ73DRAFT_102598 [Epithele typhae]KAH9927463.1 hypothetical protein BXZ73DRAFT_102598 [Epithele typhae]